VKKRFPTLDLILLYRKEHFMKRKVFMAGYFSFTRRERVGLLLLIFLIIITFLLPDFISSKNSLDVNAADSAWITAAKKLEIIETDKERKLFNYRASDDDIAVQYDRSVTRSSPGSLFYFDPNTIDETAWKKLGLKDKTIQTIKNYLSKGGHFYRSEDLKKVYGLHPNDYARLEPFIKIEARNSDDKSSQYKTGGYAGKEGEPGRFSYNIIDVNVADSTAFISLPGIGSKLAARIIGFREKLGGFYSIAQVGETYGLPDSTFQKIRQYLKLETVSVRKINLNSATLDELKAHPYIRYRIANPIIAYRNEHGSFPGVVDLKKIMAVTDEVYNKIYPYLTVD
jgi:competence protein ComEA